MALRSALGLLGLGLARADLHINIDKNSGPLASLAARELRRYLHAGGLLPSEALAGVFAPSAVSVQTVTIATAGMGSQCSAVDGEHAEGFSITQIGSETCITGYSDAGALQGVYSLLEHLGVYFSSTNPVVPARLGRFPEDGYSVASTPAFTTRGLQPFHGWWGGLEATLLPSGYNLTHLLQISPRAPIGGGSTSKSAVRGAARYTGAPRYTHRAAAAAAASVLQSSRPLRR